ncbi:sigma D regulator [Saccharospirillum alexandrii]|uniref:sigma D regulator n=1 Tax=Saccharospirillum alexandrii TaxID=2448477 RepID=UPI000FDB6DCE|nr:sigma D regulator [Saccharospirillum alexandrii]
MLENCKTARERWGGTHQMIDRWLGQRQETLVRYFDISSDTAADQQSTLLQSFCESLMDYVSAGHFEIYEQLVREAREFDDGGIELARKLYPRVEATTQVIVDFNDKYDTHDHTNQHVSDLPADLSKLGEAMTERFEMEDQMIERLHNIHKEQVA